MVRPRITIMFASGLPSSLKNMELGHQMRRHHNPRYAPEYLERKLSPSGITGIPVAAEVHIPVTQTHHVATLSPAVPVVSANVPGTHKPMAPAPHIQPHFSNDVGDPPIGNPSNPIGPVLPA
jgi:hypothetical protein